MYLLLKIVDMPFLRILNMGFLRIQHLLILKPSYIKKKIKFLKRGEQLNKNKSNSKATDRTQFVSYDLLRSGKINCVESAVINYINSFSKECRVKLSEIARGIQKSVRTVQRAINSLLKKGLINRTYTTFKRCVLSLMNLEIQTKVAKDGLAIVKNIFNWSSKNKKNSTKSSDVTSVSDHDVTSVSHPTRNETLKNKTKNIVKFNSILDPKNEKKRVDAIMDQLAKYKAYQNAQQLI